MSEVGTIIGVFAWIFVVSVLFIILTPVFMGTFVDTMDDVANASVHVDIDDYQDQGNVFKNAYYFAFAIFFIIPFLYLAVRLLFRREPDPYQRGYY